MTLELLVQHEGHDEHDRVHNDSTKQSEVVKVEACAIATRVS